MKTRWKILLGLTAVLGIAALSAIVHHFQLKWQVERFKAELKAKGEPMELAQVVSPRVPADKNCAEFFLKAEALMETNRAFFFTNTFGGKISVGSGKAIQLCVQPAICKPGEFGFTNSWDELKSALLLNQEALSNLYRLVPAPVVDFQVSYEKGFVDSGLFTNLHLLSWKKSAYLLQSSALLNIRAGKNSASTMDVRGMLALAQAMQDQRLAISELIRMAVTTMAQNPTWEMLQSTNVSASDLAILQNDWEHLDFVRSYGKALEVEQVVDAQMLTKWRKSNSELEKYLNITGKARQKLFLEDDEPPAFSQRIKFAARIFIWRNWWSYPDELRALRASEVLLNIARSAVTNNNFATLYNQQKTQLNVLGITRSGDVLANPFLLLAEPDLHSMLSDSVYTLSSCFHRVINIETSKRITITAIALKRHQLKHGNYPPDLNSLVPEFLSSVPLDPMDGQPLRYRLDVDGTFKLYSVGENGKDDDGNPALAEGAKSQSLHWHNPAALDWVWPQPATAVEIEKYFAEQAGKSH